MQADAVQYQQTCTMYVPCCAAQVEISKSYSRTKWREDLKRLLRRAGCDAKHVMFLFSDSQIKDEAFVEDINNILNAGEVPNMFPADEKMQVRCNHVGACRPKELLCRQQLCCKQPCRASGLPCPSALCMRFCVMPITTCMHTAYDAAGLQILEAVQPAAARQGLESPVQMWGYFVSQCRRHLHVVLCMSPIGDAFR
jgi:hypothetical protein